ncbi:hypothetical protein MRB53_041419 [Persea americana]|nr:hypothetical protein MRB53_041419 [Persea americana]
MPLISQALLNHTPTLFSHKILPFNKSKMMVSAARTREACKRRRDQALDKGYITEINIRSRTSVESRDAPTDRNKAAAKAHDRSAKPQIPYGQRHKRKWEGYVKEQDPLHGSMTHRRLARELDGHVQKDVKVDYGDETGSADATSSAQQNTDQQRRVVSYADD